MFLTVFSFRQKALVVGEYIIFTSVGLLSVFGNILIIVVIRKTKEFRHSQYVFKTSIAVSDIIWAFFIFLDANIIAFDRLIASCSMVCQPYTLPYDSSLDYKNNFTGYDIKHYSCQLYLAGKTLEFVRFESAYLFLMEISLIISFVSLIFAAGDRYFAIAFPFKYKKANTIKIAKVLSVVIWILSVLMTIITNFYEVVILEYRLILLQPSPCNNPYQIFESIFLFTLFVLLWILTLLTLKNIYKSYKRSLNLGRMVRNKFLTEKQMSIVLILMVVAFTISLSPTLYIHVLYYVLKSKYVDCDFFLYVNISKYFLSTNSIWNILVYNVINKKFRLAFKALFKKPR